MRSKKRILISCLILLVCNVCSLHAVSRGMKKVVDDALDFSVKQSMSMFNVMQSQKGILPRTAKNEIVYIQASAKKIHIGQHKAITCSHASNYIKNYSNNKSFL